MLGLLVATVTFPILVALLLAAFVAVTVVPVFVSLQMADVRRFSTLRWLLFSGGAVVVGVGYAYVLHHSHLPRIVQLLPLVLTWGGPGVLWLLDEGQTRIGGRAGQHE
jgi:hypothetical protein